MRAILGNARWITVKMYEKYSSQQSCFFFIVVTRAYIALVRVVFINGNIERKGRIVIDNI